MSLTFYPNWMQLQVPVSGAINFNLQGVWVQGIGKEQGEQERSGVDGPAGKVRGWWPQGSLLWALPHLMQPAPETQDQDFLGTSRVIPAPSLAHEPKAEFLLCSLQFGLQGCLLSFLNGHLSPDQSHEVVLYLAVNTTYVCSFSRLKNRLLI